MSQGEKNGLLSFHEGWTDILNCFAYITYYQKRYDKLYVIYWTRTYELFKFYCREYTNIILINLDDIHSMIRDRNNFNIGDLDLNLFGFNDRWRLESDPYYFAFHKKMKYNPEKFAQYFYESYDRPFSFRRDHFEITRDVELENNLYTKTVRDPVYRLTHFYGCQGKLLNINSSIDSIELNNLTNYFFDSIKIIENAKEIIVIDSVWSVLCFLIDSKYKLFSHIPITVYCARNYVSFFDISLPNWTIVEKNDIPNQYLTGISTS
jgi:hypothetical protein